MPDSLVRWICSALLCGLLVACLNGRTAVKLGVLLLPSDPEQAAQYLSEPLLDVMTRDLLQDLLNAGIGEVALLPGEFDPEARPTFETLVENGRALGCTGVVALQVKRLTFTAEDKTLPLVGDVLVGRVDIHLSGGLIDVATATGIAPIEAKATKQQSPLRGLTPDDEVDYDGKTFAGSLPGQGLLEARRKVVEAVKENVEKLTPGTPVIRKRDRAPLDVSFSETSSTMTVITGYDQRGLVAVVNRGEAARTFVIKPLRAIPDVVIGLVGQGSLDAPCTLAPGQWKYVRVLANVDLIEGEYTLRLGLFAADEGEEPDLEAKPTDTAALTLRVTPTEAQVTLTVVAQDPLTLAYTCRLTNIGDDLNAYAVRPLAGQAGLVEINPELDTHLYLPRRGAITFTVSPHFPAGTRTLDIRLDGYNNGAPDVSLPLSFTIPEGMNFYYGLGHTSTCVASGDSYCTNTGEIAWPPEKPFKMSDKMKKSMDRDTAIRKDSVERWRKMVDSGEQRDRMIKAPNKTTDYNPPTEYSLGGRGGVVRPAYAARVPGLERDMIAFPSVVHGKTATGLLCHAPDEDGGLSVLFATTPNDGTEETAYDLLNEEEHSGRWPYAGTDGTRAFAVWEDTTTRQSNVAFAASGEGMTDWSVPRYLTTHGAGVEDPVIACMQEGRLVVAWVDLRAGGGQIVLRLSPDSGATFATEVSIPRVAGETQAWPQVTFLPGKREMMLVYVSTLGAAQRVLAVRLKEDGQPAGEPVALSTPGASCGEPQIVSLADGRCAAAWREGDGAAGEIYFAVQQDQRWVARRVTNDGAYSEYPYIGRDANGLWLGYHSDISGVADFLYLRRSTDEGATWGEAVTQRGYVPPQRAWLEANFALAEALSNYAPYTTRLLVNGTEVGVLPDMMPEGTYLFPVLPENVYGSAGRLAGNEVKVLSEVANEAHFIMLSQVRLIAHWPYSQVGVIAANQAEADALAEKVTVNRNHNQPDLVLTANNMPALPRHYPPDTRFTLHYQVHNIGEGTATDARVMLFSDAGNGDAGARKSTFAEKTLGAIKPGEVKEVTFELTFDPARMARIYAKATLKEDDHFVENGVWGVSLTDGFSSQPPPKVGTDIPNIFRAPGLLDIITLPDLPGLLDLIMLPELAGMLRMPGLPALPDPRGEIQSRLDDLLPGFELPLP